METRLEQDITSTWGEAARAGLEMPQGALLGPLLQLALVLSESPASVEEGSEAQPLIGLWRSLRDHPTLKAPDGPLGLLDELITLRVPVLRKALQGELTGLDTHEQAHPFLRKLMREAQASPQGRAQAHQLELALRIFREVFCEASHGEFVAAQREAYACAEQLKGPGLADLDGEALDENNHELIPFLAWVTDSSAKEGWRSLIPLLRHWCTAHPWFDALLRQADLGELWKRQPTSNEPVATISECDSLDFSVFVVGPETVAQRWLLDQGAKHGETLTVFPKKEHESIDPARCEELSSGSAGEALPEEAMDGLRVERGPSGLMRLTALQWSLEQIDSGARRTHSTHQHVAKAFERWLASSQVWGGVVVVSHSQLAQASSKASLLRRLRNLVDQVANARTKFGLGPFRWCLVLDGPVRDDALLSSDHGRTLELAASYHACLEQSLVSLAGRDAHSLRHAAACSPSACESPAFARRIQLDLAALEEWLTSLTERGFRQIAIAYTNATNDEPRGKVTHTRTLATSRFWKELHERIAESSRQAREEFATRFAKWPVPSRLRREALEVAESCEKLRTASLLPTSKDWDELVRLVDRTRFSVDRFEGFFERRRDTVLETAPAYNALERLLERLLADLGVASDLSVDVALRKVPRAPDEEGTEALLERVEAMTEGIASATSVPHLEWPESGAPQLSFEAAGEANNGWVLPPSLVQRISAQAGRESLSARDYLTATNIGRVEKVLFMLALRSEGTLSRPSWHRALLVRGANRDPLHHWVLTHGGVWQRLWQTDAAAIHAICIAAEALGRIPAPMKYGELKAADWRFRHSQLLSLLEANHFETPPSTDALAALTDEWLRYGEPTLGGLPPLRSRRDRAITELNGHYARVKRASQGAPGAESVGEPAEAVRPHLPRKEAIRLRKEAYLSLCCSLAASKIAERYNIRREQRPSGDNPSQTEVGQRVEGLGGVLRELEVSRKKCADVYHAATWVQSQWLAGLGTTLLRNPDELDRIKLTRAVLAAIEASHKESRGAT